MVPTYISIFYVHRYLPIGYTYLFIIYLQVSSFQSSTIVTSTLYSPQLTTENKLLVNIPLAVVGEESDFVNFNPFKSTYNYTNILSSGNLITNSPLKGESSTLKAFFMSEMDRLSTVKTITGIDLE